VAAAEVDAVVKKADKPADLAHRTSSTKLDEGFHGTLTNVKQVRGGEEEREAKRRGKRRKEKRREETRREMRRDEKQREETSRRGRKRKGTSKREEAFFLLSLVGYAKDVQGRSHPA
jgi:hypothetical protein